ncbi:MAG: DUF6804 family protein [Bacteroidales bacterium]
MKVILLICASLLFLSIANLPIGYFTFLRIVVTMGALYGIITEYKEEINFWVIAFALVTILFNPILPIHLNDKSLWIPIDLTAGLLFGVKFFQVNNNSKK